MIETVSAQAADPGSVRSPWFAAGIGRTPPAAASGSAELEAQDTQIGAGLGVVSSASVRVDIGVDYQYTRYEYDGIDSRDRDLHRLQFPLHFATDAGQWRLSGYVAPGVSTSSNVMKDLLNRASREDLIVTGRLLVSRRRDEVTWFAGVAHDRRFGRSLGYPVAGVEFEPKPGVAVRLAFPDPGVTITAKNRQVLEARVYPAGHQWHVESDDFSRDFDYRVEAWRSQLTWRLPLWRALALDLTAGYEFGREHHFTNDPGTRLKIDVEDQWFVAIGFDLGPAPLPAVHGGNL